MPGQFAIAIYAGFKVAAHLIRVLMWPATPQLEKFMAPFRTLIASVFVVTFAGCAATPEGHSPGRDLGLLWVKHAAEYTAVTTQVYKMAELALPHFIEDTSWSALPAPSDGSPSTSCFMNSSASHRPSAS